MELLSVSVAAFTGACIPIVCFAFWLGGKLGDIKHIQETCGRREEDHKHHYQASETHAIKIGNLDTRVKSLEDWRKEVS